MAVQPETSQGVTVTVCDLWINLHVSPIRDKGIEIRLKIK